MREPVELRRQRILGVVRSRGAVRVGDLAAELEVSVVTVRRDVEELARAGQLRRGHGVVRSIVPVEEAGAVGAAAGAPRVLPGEDGAAIGLVVPERHSYLFEILHGARTVLEEAGMRIALHIAPAVSGGERPMVEQALASGVQGLLIAPRWRGLGAEEADYGWLGSLDVPTVLMERRPRPGSALHALDSVCSDHWYGVHLAVGHLIALGHRRIVLGARDDSPTARAVRAAFAAIAAERAEIEDWAVTLSSPTAVPEPAERSRSESAAEPTPDVLDLLRARGATAAVLHGDVDALMLVQRFQEAGIRVPEDFSVVAYDDVVAALGSTPLTAVAPPKTEVGRAAAELLLHRLRRPAGERPAPVRRIELLPDLQVRGSTGPVSEAGE
ncbi:substrate-binding domain-containing protein [Streptomyces purpurogeneiscleroticus]|uniref:substrate-binding domain-containing protein n=1 Tax=Streptomyces purpurogeneiscleroticus TaxID=68259 RepID=UPI001CC11EDB|nr:substrate-binding domain-containing protein [Streptomyces purpurogeneiscleroticus]MBZ4014738.1 LacI family transcriptional regulator [Streptomyces purpurogeneiscleroticus]